MSVTRRAALGTLSVSLFAASSARTNTSLQATPAQIKGPYYPTDTNIERDADLTRLIGRRERAAGPVIEVTGRVLDIRGLPIGGALLELWQANAAGRYRHPKDDSGLPLDPNFQGYATVRTGPDGTFKITSVKPGPYQLKRSVRTPHLHWRIATKQRTLTTQMYFQDEALNDADRILGRATNPRALIAQKVTPDEAGASGFSWDVIMRG